MNLYEYQNFAMRTAGDTLGDQTHGLVVTALGLSGEALELGECLWEHERWKQDAIKELGDCCWYVARGCAALGVEMEQTFNGPDYILQFERTTGSDGDSGAFHLSILMMKTGVKFGELVKKIYGQGHPANVPALADLLIKYWILLELLAQEIGIPISDILEANIAKLRARFPDGFTTEASVGRVES
jgi:NTP pyrophosphatase (non-canonical NTP hydrolase)